MASCGPEVEPRLLWLAFRALHESIQVQSVPWELYLSHHSPKLRHVYVSHPLVVMPTSISISLSAPSPVTFFSRGYGSTSIHSINEWNICSAIEQNPFYSFQPSSCSVISRKPCLLFPLEAVSPLRFCGTCII